MATFQLDDSILLDINQAPFVFVVAWLVVCVLSLEVRNYPWFVFEIPVPSLKLTART